MNHLTQEDLILHYYGEEGDSLAIEQHLDGCPSCRSAYGALQRVLNVLDTAPVPERGPEYAAAVWARLEHRLPGRSRWRDFPPARWAWAAAMALMILTAFLAGRFSPRPAAPPAVASQTGPVRERILLVAVGDLLDRSEMVLVELANAKAQPALDISAEQQRAGELISENRLYRQTATRVGEQPIAALLDELERVLLEIARGPSRVTPAELDRLRQRIQAEGLLFKIRIVESNVRNQETIGERKTL